MDRFLSAAHFKKTKWVLRSILEGACTAILRDDTIYPDGVTLDQQGQLHAITISRCAQLSGPNAVKGYVWSQAGFNAIADLTEAGLEKCAYQIDFEKRAVEADKELYATLGHGNRL